MQAVEDSPFVMPGGDVDPSGAWEEPIARQCGLCSEEIDEAYQHPFFSIRSLSICGRCRDSMRARVLARKGKDLAGDGGRAGEVQEGNEAKGAFFLAVVEGMVLQLRSSDRENAACAAAYNELRDRPREEWVAKRKALGMSFDMLQVARTVLSKLGVSVRSGKLVWASDTFHISVLDAMDVVRTAWPETMEDLEVGSTRGERAWQDVFKVGLESDRTSCVILQKVFGLIGVDVKTNEKCTHDGGDKGCKCEMKVDTCSVLAMMHRAARLARGKCMKSLFSQTWPNSDALRTVQAEDFRRAGATGDQVDVDGCCLCGNEHEEGKFPLRVAQCCDCARRFCSSCICHVLGVAEYARAVREEVYRCMLCRFRDNKAVFPGGEAKAESSNAGSCADGGGDDKGGGEGEERSGKELGVDGRIRKWGATGRGGKRVRKKSLAAPLVLVSREVRRVMMGRGEGGESEDKVGMEQAIGVAKLCEMVNDKVLNDGRAINCAAYEAVCIVCTKMIAKHDGEEACREACSVGECGNVAHKACLSEEERRRRRGARAKWVCGAHECAGCEQRDENKLVRCRTCAKAYCKEHAPAAGDMFVFTERLVGCGGCRRLVMGPKMPIVGGGASRTSRKGAKQVMPLAIANVVTQRQAAVRLKKDSESS